MNETPTPPEGYRLLTGEEKTKPLPMDTLVLWGEHWEPSTLRGHKITLSSDFGNLYATAQPLPCFQSPDQGPEHWADLCENDVIQDGDEWELDGLWHPAEAIGCRVGDIGHRYRRRVAPPTAEQRIAEPFGKIDMALRIAELEREVESLHRQWPEFGYKVEWRDGRHWVYPTNGGDFQWNGDPVFNAIHCARFYEQLTQLRATIETLTRERDEARAETLKAEADALQEQEWRAEAQAQLAASEKDRTQWLDVLRITAAEIECYCCSEGVATRQPCAGCLARAAVKLNDAAMKEAK